jgi:hypothetical protein
MHGRLNMAGDLRAFFDSLNREEARLATQIASDTMGFILRVALNELDLDYEIANREEHSGDTEERSYLMRIGVNRAIKLALEAHQRFEAPTLTFQRSARLSLPILALISKLAVIEHGRRVAQSVAAGVGQIERIENNRFLVRLPPAILDLELHERELERFYVGEARRIFADVHDVVVDAKIGDHVRELVRELVYPYAKHFIGYESDPSIDVYFFGPGYNEIQISKGYDTFHFATKFGGMTYQHYKLAAAFIVGVAIRHRTFVQALLEKSPTTRLEDVLTVSVETKGFLEGLRDFINYFGESFEGYVPVTDDGVRVLFDVLSISRKNTCLLDRPGAPIPPLIQCSDDHVIRPIVGARSGIMQFLLNSLQQAFPRDYDRAQRQREAAMQAAMKRVLGTVFPQVEYRCNVRLRQARMALTDIDLVVVDTETGHIILVQLKHQDPYGDDIAARQGRTARLNDKVVDWISKVRRWLADATNDELRATLRLPKSMRVHSIEILVLARHYAHSLRSSVKAEDATFANWNQFATAVERVRRVEASKSLDGLLEELRSLSLPPEEEFLPETPSEWQVGDLHFSVSQSPC